MPFRFRPLRTTFILPTDPDMRFHLKSFFILFSLLSFSGCGEELPPIPAPPAGVTMIETEGNSGAFEIVEDNAGNFVMVGSVDTDGNSETHDFLVVKTDASGNEIARGIYDLGNHDIGRAIIQTADGGYLLAGSTGQNWDTRQLGIVKLDAQLNPVFQRFIPITDQWWEIKEIVFIKENSVGFLFVILNSNQNLFTIRTDANGGLIQTSVRPGQENFVTYGYHPYTNTPDGGFANVFYDWQTRSYTILKHNADGFLTQEAVFFEAVRPISVGLNLWMMPDGSYMFSSVGQTNSALYRVTPDLSSMRFVGNISGNQYCFNDIEGGTDHHLYMIGKPEIFTIDSQNNEIDFTLRETDSTGQLIAEQAITGPRTELLRALKLRSNNRPVVVGQSDSFSDDYSTDVLIYFP
jgi:hypothetical protein